MRELLRRLPPVPTAIVLLAVAAMIRLGVWQLHRLHEKEALLARFQANAALPAVALPAVSPPSDATLFRRVGAWCLQPAGWEAEAGGSVGGVPGWRHIARCRTGAEGPGFAVDVGTSASDKPPAWGGGPVRGRLTWAPDHGSLLGRMLGPPPAREPLIVAESPAAGLSPSRPPDPANVPNNHLAYAVQWFLFAGVATAVYVVALWRRRRPVAPSPPRR